jgi:hypothetical protein
MLSHEQPKLKHFTEIVNVGPKVCIGVAWSHLQEGHDASDTKDVVPIMEGLSPASSMWSQETAGTTSHTTMVLLLSPASDTTTKPIGKLLRKENRCRPC